MRELSIKIKIADREYPMTVKAEEEERVRRAGKLINERLKSYREKFGIDETPEVSMADVDIPEEPESDGRETLTEYDPIGGKKKTPPLDIGHIPSDVGI